MTSIPFPVQTRFTTDQLIDGLVQCIVALCITASIIKHAYLFIADSLISAMLIHPPTPYTTTDTLMDLTQRELMLMVGTKSKLSKEKLIEKLRAD